MPEATVIIPHAFTTRWTQIAVASLLQHRNDADFSIIVVDNSSHHDSIKGITETDLGKHCRVILPKDPSRGGHQLALGGERGLEYVEHLAGVQEAVAVRVVRIEHDCNASENMWG